MLVCTPPTPPDSFLTENTDEIVLYRIVYVFHTANEWEVMLGAKPRLEERGPYTYRERRFRTDWSFESPELIRYRTRYQYNFLPERSCAGCTEHDVSTVPNIPMVGLAAAVEDAAGPGSFWGRLAGAALTASEGLYANLTVRQIVEGYDDRVLLELAKLAPSVIGNNTGFPGVGANMSTDADIPPGLNVASTGYPDPFKDIASLKVWRGNASLTVWAPGNPANIVRGSSTGTQYRRGLTCEDKVSAWVNSLYMAVDLVCVGEITAEGIRMLDFRLDNSTFLNASVVPAHAGQYMFGPSGVDNLTSANSGTPIFMSKPHFLDTDPRYLEAVEGIAPNRTLHDTVVGVEPNTGSVMLAAQRIQLNVRVAPMMAYGQLVTPVIHPVAWISEQTVIDAPLAKKFRNGVYLLLTMIKYCRWILVALGGVMLVVMALMARYLGWFAKRSDNGGETKALLDGSRWAPASYSGVDDDDDKRSRRSSRSARGTGGKKRLNIQSSDGV